MIGLYSKPVQHWRGSLGVVTVNCARLGYLHAGDEERLAAKRARLAA